MSKIASYLLVATGSLFVLEGCKSEWDQALDNLNGGTKKLNKLAQDSSKKHKISDCDDIRIKVANKMVELSAKAAKKAQKKGKLPKNHEQNMEKYEVAEAAFEKAYQACISENVEV